MDVKTNLCFPLLYNLYVWFTSQICPTKSHWDGKLAQIEISKSYPLSSLEYEKILNNYLPSKLSTMFPILQKQFQEAICLPKLITV